MITTPSQAGQSYGPVRIEVVTASRRIVGHSRALDEKRRLGDLLNDREEELRLSPVSVVNVDGSKPLILPELAIQKKTICAAIPWETEAQRARQRVYRSRMALPPRVLVDVAVSIPPFDVTGSVGVPFRGGLATLTASAASMEARFRPSSLRRFFPLTGARLMYKGRSAYFADVMFVNRDLVASIEALQIATTPEAKTS